MLRNQSTEIKNVLIHIELFPTSEVNNTVHALRFVSI